MGKRSREKRERRENLIGQKAAGISLPLFRHRAEFFGLEKILLFVITFGTYLVLFAPLVIVKYSFFPYVTPKTIFFRIIVEIILAAYLFLVVAFPRYRPRATQLTIAIGLFLLVLILTSLTGINFERSFWSTYERMTGLFTLFHLFAFFIVLSNVFKKREDWERIFAASVIVGVLLSFYVLFGSETSSRGGGTIGNSSFMAAYLLFDIFFALILFLSKRGFWQVLSGISLLIMGLVLLNSTGRGAIAAFGLGLGLLVLGYLIFSQQKVLKRLGYGIILGLIILTIILFILQPSFVRNEITALLAEMKPRFTVWETALKGWQERFLLGWGPENFNVVFLRYFNPCVFLGECGGEIWFDRAHNIIFDVGVTSGIIGLLSYFFIFAVAIYKLLKISAKVIEKRNLFLPLGIAVLLIVYLFQNLLVFDMINTYLVFFLSLAFIDFLTRKEEPVGTGGKPINFAAGSVIVIAIALLLWLGNIQPLQSAFNITNIIVLSPKIEDSSLFFQNSLGSLMEKYEAREQFAQKVSDIDFKQQNQEVMAAAFALAEKEMEKSVEKNGLDFRHRLFLGRVYISSFRFSGNSEKLALAEETLKKAIELSPTNQQGYWYLAEVKLSKGQFKEAEGLIKKTVELEPRFARSHWYLAVVYNIEGENELAEKEAKRAAELDPAFASQIEKLLGKPGEQK